MKRSDLALAALASAAVPGMKPVAVAGMVVDEPGAEHQQAVVEDATGRRWLVRSPLTAVAGARLQRNDELVRQLSRHVPFKVPAPAGYAVVGPEGQAAVYPHVEGMTLDLSRLPGGGGLAHAVGRAIAAIHNIPRAAFEQQDVPVFDASGCRQRLISEVDRAAETGRVPTRLLARWEEAFDAAPLWQFAATPVHGAFRGAAVLVAFADDDASSGRVVAVTDWEEAMVADPAVDLAELYDQTSPDAWEAVLDSYALARAHRPDPYLHARARLVSETRRLRGLAAAVADGDEDAARRQVDALRRMDRLTEDEDSLVPTTARSSAATDHPSHTVRDVPTVTSTGEADLDTSTPFADEPEPTDASAGSVGPEDDPDVTAEVPVPGAVDLDSAGSDAPAEMAHAEPEDVEPDGPDAEPAASPHRGEGADGSRPDAGDVDALDPSTPADEMQTSISTDDLTDEDRLHELYGMPTPPDETEPRADDHTSGSGGPR